MIGPTPRRIAFALLLLTLGGCESLDPFAEKETPLPGERHSVFTQAEIDAMIARGKPQSSDAADTVPVEPGTDRSGR
jgi:hypothetical protein